jgi:signal transduction histidine kinase
VPFVPFRRHDFRHIRDADPACYVPDTVQTRPFALAGLFVWTMVGLPVVVAGAISPGLMASWAAVYLLFAALFAAELRFPSLPLIALQAACIVVVVLLLCDGFEGTLMVLIAMRLASRVKRSHGLAWIAVQTALLAAAIAIHWTPRSALLLTPPYLGFQILAFLTVQALARESRSAERLRIAHELHDSLGHHLTALTLNLESARMRSDGDAKADVEKAQALARRLLDDVRAIVEGRELTGGVDLAKSLQTITVNVPQPRVHLDIDRQLEGVQGAHVIVRCVQEIVTNAARHSGAQNLWIEVRRDARWIQIRARDDGRGCEQPADGFGLRGMRERLREAGGDLEIITEPGHGFGVVAMVPAST